MFLIKCQAVWVCSGLPVPLGKGEHADPFSVARVRARTSKGITDLLLPLDVLGRTPWRVCRKVTSLNNWIVSICCCDGGFTFLCIFQVVLGYSLDASPELVNQAYIVNAHVLEISPRGRSFHQIYQNYLKLLLKGFFLIIAIKLEWLGCEISQNERKIY